MDTETGMYYLMSRYYDPVTHRFLNADGYFQTGLGILDSNMNAYCGNNPLMFMDPTGLCYVAQYTNAGTYIGTKWVIKTAVPGVPGFCNDCKSYYPNSSENYYEGSLKNNKNTKNGNNWIPRKDPKKGSKNRQKTGLRERNVGNPNAEEHSRIAKGTKVKKSESLIPTPDTAVPIYEYSEQHTFLNAFNPFDNSVFDLKGTPNTGEKPIFEQMWDDVVRMFTCE